jgi:hypothetical protein
MSGTRPTGGSPAALAAITAAMIIGLGAALIQRQADRDPQPEPVPSSRPVPSGAPTVTPGPTAPAHATQGPVSAYPRCADVSGDRADCVALVSGAWSLVTADGATVPVTVVAEEARDGVRWVTVR